MTVIEGVVAAKQPALPSFNVTWFDEDGCMRSAKFQWPAQTRAWWKMWAESKLAEKFTSTDWSELLDTARLHAEFWSGNIKVAAELRLRVANFGATPADRARLRIVFAEADKAEKKTPTGGTGKKATGARARRGALRAVK